jgi:hypothetical protein
MDLFKTMLLQEHQKRAAAEVDNAVTVINKIYNEWKKRQRRINAVDIITTSANKIANINPTLVDHIHKAARAKLVIIIMRCLDLPVWKPIETKEKIYKKLYPLIKRLQNDVVNTGTNGKLRDVIMTRLSAAISHQTSQCEVFVAYESKLPTSYIRFLFGSTPPEKTYRMQSLLLPADFDSLVDILKINQDKAIKRYSGL